MNTQRIAEKAGWFFAAVAFVAFLWQSDHGDRLALEVRVAQDTITALAERSGAERARGDSLQTELDDALTVAAATSERLDSVRMATGRVVRRARARASMVFDSLVAVSDDGTVTALATLEANHARTVDALLAAHADEVRAWAARERALVQANRRALELLRSHESTIALFDVERAERERLDGLRRDQIGSERRKAAALGLVVGLVLGLLVR